MPGWRGDRATQNEEQLQTGPTKKWKRSTSTKKNQADDARPWLKITLVVGILAGTVFSVMRILEVPPRQFTVVNVFSAWQTPEPSAGISDEQMASHAFLPASAQPPRFQIPEFIEVQVTVQPPSLNREQEILRGWEGALKKLHDNPDVNGVSGETYILYLQTNFTDYDGGVVLLNGDPASPDVKNNEYLALSELQKRLREFFKKRQQARVLLLVDTPPPYSPIRSGITAGTAVQELLKWPNEDELKRLVVVAAAADDQLSWPASMRFGGRSAFAVHAERLLSEEGDRNSDLEVTAAEFIEALRDQTQDWLDLNRGKSLQELQISPTLEEIKKKDFRLVRRPEPLPKQSAQDAEAKDESLKLVKTLKKEWQKLIDLQDRQAIRWGPLELAIATEQLQRSEQSLLNGDLNAARNHREQAQKYRIYLEKLKENYCPSATETELSDPAGLPKSQLRDLPSFPRLKHAGLWSDEPSPSGNTLESTAGNDSSESPASQQIEDVLEASAEQFFPELKPEKIDLLKEHREEAELTTARLFGLAHFLQPSVLAAEQQLLELEDLIFSGTEATAEQQQNRQRWNALKEFAEQYQQAQLELMQAELQLTGLLNWCSISGTLEGELNELLKKNLQDSAGTKLPSKPEEISNSVDFIPDASGGRDGTGTVLDLHLRRVTVRLLIVTRSLQSYLRQAEESMVEESMVTESLKRQTVLTRSLEKWLVELKKVQERLREVVRNHVVDAVTESLEEVPELPSPDQWLRLYHRSRALLRVTNLNADERSALLRLTIELDSALAELNPDSSQELSLDDELRAFAAATQKQLLWLGQRLTLLPIGSGEDASQREKLLRKLADEKLAVGEIGQLLRTEWQRQRMLVMNTLNNRSAVTWELLLAEHRARLLPCFDAQKLMQQPSLMEIVHDRLRLDYQKLHIQRLLLGGWTLPDDSVTSKEWFRRESERWTKHIPGLTELIDKSVGEWRVTFGEVRDLVFDDGNAQHRKLQLEITNGGLKGTATLRMPSASPLFELKIERPQIRIDPDSVQNPMDKEFTVALAGGEPVRDVDCESVELIPQVFFRGRVQKAASFLVDPCEPESWRQVREARTPTAEIQLKSADARPIAFVLDWSGSMESSENGPEKYKQALDALKKRLDDLPSTDKKVSLRLFGHRIGFSKPEEKVKRNYNFEKEFADELPEEAFPDIDNIAAEDDTQLIIPSAILDQQQLDTFDRVIDKLRNLGPYGGTPLLRALIEAVTKDLNSKPGIVIALTDGLPTDNDENGEKLFQLSRAIDKAGSQVLLIAFGLTDDKLGKIREIFSTEDLAESVKVAAATDKEAILDAIRKNDTPPKLVIGDSSGMREVEAEPTDEGRLVYRTSLPASSDYQLQYSGANAPGIKLQAGDHLRAEIDWRDSAPAIRFTRTRPRNHDLRKGLQPQVTAGPAAGGDFPASLAALEPVQRNDNDNLELTLILDHDSWERPVRQPAEIEFDYQVAENSGKFADFRPNEISEEYKASKHGCPAWGVTISNWEDSYGIRVHGYLKMKSTSPDLVIPWKDLKQADNSANALETAKLNPDPRLPRVRVWYRQASPQRLQIRLDPVSDHPEDQNNPPQEIRVQIGQCDTTMQRESFRAREFRTTIIQRENRSVIWELERTDGEDWSEEFLQGMEVGLTSRKSRRQDAFHAQLPDLRIQ